MRSSVLSILLLTIVCTSVVQIGAECTCGGLGPGINPCTCDEVAVKAAKLPKPLIYASPEAINEAAAARNLAAKLAKSGATLPYPRIFVINRELNNSSSSSSTSTDSSSSVTIVNGVDGHVEHTSNSDVENLSTSSCGCSGNSDAVESRDIESDTAGRIVPNFPPIGDLCYPNQIDPRTGAIVQTMIRVTPAHPGKIRCTCNEISRIVVCKDLITGHVISGKIKNIIPGTSAHHGISGHFTSGVNREGVFEKIGSYHKGSFSGSSETSGTDTYSNLHGISGTGTYGNLHGVSETGTYGNLHGVSGTGTYGNLHGVSGTGTYGNLHGISGTGTYSNLHGISGTGTYSNLHGIGETGSFSHFPSVSKPYGALNTYGNSMSSLSSSSSSSFSNSAFEEGSTSSQWCDDEDRHDVSVPRLPADPVSLSLAYRNLFPQSQRHKYGRKLIPEDKLSFGHRTIPTEVKSEKVSHNVPEEKLQIVEKPVVELKVTSLRPITAGPYDEKDEQNLAKLEALESEILEEEEERTGGSFITYSDLGYEPINTRVPTKYISKTHGGLAEVDRIHSEDLEGPCGPLGPRNPDYVPGSIYVEQEVIETEPEIPRHLENYGLRYIPGKFGSEDELASRAGILSRLRTIARQQASAPCPQ